MALLIGLGLAVAVAAFARIVSLDRDRAFYATVLIVVGSYYVLFATMAGDVAAVRMEILFFLIFAATAVSGFRSSMWVVAAGLAAHGVFDFFRTGALPASGAPDWWPSFCGGFDVAAALALGALLVVDKGNRTRLRKR